MSARALVKRRLFAAAIGLVTAWHNEAVANPFDTFGAGSRERAMASAAAANPSGVSANYYNPAALARESGLLLSAGYVLADHSLAMNGRRTTVDAVRGFEFGLVAPGRIFRIPFAFGLLVHLPDERVSRVRARRQEEPRWELYDNRSQRLALSANVALSPLPWLSLGGGMSFMSSTRGKLDITGSADIFFPDQSQLRHEVDADLSAIRYPQFGALAKLSEAVSLALVHRGSFSLSLDIDAHVYGDISQLTTATIALQSYSINNFQPAQWVLGTSARILKDESGDRLTLQTDATWVRWSSYVPPTARVGATLDIPPPKGGWPPGIRPPTNPAPAVVLPLKTRDRIDPAISLEATWLRNDKFEGKARVGYSFRLSPFEAQSKATNFVDADKHLVGLGVGFTLKKRVVGPLLSSVTCDAHGQLQALSPRQYEKADPADYVGDLRATGHVVSAGLTVTARFDR